MKRFDYESVAGHELICAKLRQSVEAHKTVNAYLFAGHAGIGKKTVALPFAASLLCEHPQQGRPCLTCTSCKLLAADSHPDLIWLETPSDKNSIGVEKVRDELIKEAYIRPFTSSRKVFIIKEGELLTQGAQNALLKILEEPPEYAVFLILTAAQNQILETVRSRCLKLQFLPLSQQACRQYFMSFSDFDENRKRLAMSFAQGNIGRGKKILCDDSFYALYQSTVSNMVSLTKSIKALTTMKNFLTENHEQLDSVIDFMLVFLRDALHMAITKTAKPICSDRQEEIKAFSQKLTPGKIIALTEAVMHYRQRLMRNAGSTIAGLELLTRMQEEIND